MAGKALGLGRVCSNICREAVPSSMAKPCKSRGKTVIPPISQTVQQDPAAHKKPEAGLLALLVFANRNE